MIGKSVKDNNGKPYRLYNSESNVIFTPHEVVGDQEGGEDVEVAVNFHAHQSLIWKDQDKHMRKKHDQNTDVVRNEVD